MLSTQNISLILAAATAVAAQGAPASITDSAALASITSAANDAIASAELHNSASLSDFNKVATSVFDGVFSSWKSANPSAVSEPLQQFNDDSNSILLTMSGDNALKSAFASASASYVSANTMMTTTAPGGSPSTPVPGAPTPTSKSMPSGSATNSKGASPASTVPTAGAAALPTGFLPAVAGALGAAVMYAL